MNDDKMLWGAIAQFEKFGPRRLKRLRAGFPNAKILLASSRPELVSVKIEESVADAFIGWRQSLNIASFEKIISSYGIDILMPEDEAYPSLLRETADPPQVLFCRGNLASLYKPLAVVGTRKITNYGRQAVVEIVSPLARGGVSIISGLALGIDAAVHAATIKNNGHTVAVLGCGLDDPSIYPATNKNLAKEILASGGAIISEFAPGALSLKHHFPIRNRIIAGMSLATLVIEADLDSGSLITARAALDENRDVFAVPGDIFRQTSRGVNNLLKMGARLAASATDVAEIFDVKLEEQKLQALAIPASPEEAEILLCLKKEPKHIDELAREAKLDISVVSAMLTILEMKGSARAMGNMHYSLNR